MRDDAGHLGRLFNPGGVLMRDDAMLSWTGRYDIDIDIDID